MGNVTGRDDVLGEVVRGYCDDAEGMLGTYHSHTDAMGNRYENPEEILEWLMRALRNEVPEPEKMEDE